MQASEVSGYKPLKFSCFELSGCISELQEVAFSTARITILHQKLLQASTSATSHSGQKGSVGRLLDSSGLPWQLYWVATHVL